MPLPSFKAILPYCALAAVGSFIFVAITFYRGCSKERTISNESYYALFLSDNSVKFHMGLQVCKALTREDGKYCPINMIVDASAKEFLSDPKFRTGINVVLAKMKDYDRECDKENGSERLKFALIYYLHLVDRMPGSLTEIRASATPFFPYDPWPMAAIDPERTFKHSLEMCKKLYNTKNPPAIGPKMENIPDSNRTFQ